MPSIAHPTTVAAPARALPLHGFPRGWLWGGGFAVWTVLALLSASQHAATRMRFGEGPVDWGRVVGYTLLDWYTCAVFTPAILWLAGRFPLERGGWRRAPPVHALAGVRFVLLKLALFVPLARALGWMGSRTFLDLVYLVVRAPAHLLGRGGAGARRPLLPGARRAAAPRQPVGGAPVASHSP